MARTQPAPRIVNITSVVGLTGNAGQANYAASKAGLVGLTKSAAKEVARWGVCVNAVAPGFIETAMTDAMTELAKDALKKSIPLRRIGSSEDVAAKVSFLCSDGAGLRDRKLLVVTVWPWYVALSSKKPVFDGLPDPAAHLRHPGGKSAHGIRKTPDGALRCAGYRRSGVKG